MVTNEIEKPPYEVIQNLGNEFLRLVRVGLVSSHFLSWITIYEDYLNERKKCKKTESAMNIAVKYEISTRQVFVIVKFMEGN